MVRWLRLAVPVIGATLAMPAAASRVHDLLALVADGARFGTVAVAAGTLRVRDDDGEHTISVRVLARGRTLRVEAGGTTALVRGTKALVLQDGRPHVRRDVALGGSNVLLQDLAVFTTQTLHFPQISDDGPMGVVVTSAPRQPSIYALVVHTINPKHARITRTKYFRHAVNNLVKRSRFTDFVYVADGWRPQTSTWDGVDDTRASELTLVWRTGPTVPWRLFRPIGLAESSDGIFD